MICVLSMYVLSPGSPRLSSRFIQLCSLSCSLFVTGSYDAALLGLGLVAILLPHLPRVGTPGVLLFGFGISVRVFMFTDVSVPSFLAECI